MKRILHISPDFNYSCGRSKLVYLYLKYLSINDNYEVHFITNGGDSLDRLKELSNLKYDILEFSSGYKNLFYYKSLYKNLKNYIVENKITLIHSHHRFPELISTKIHNEGMVKTITTAHSYVNGFRHLSYKSHKIISVSNSVSNYLISKYHIEKKRIITLYNPIQNITKLDFSIVEQFKKKNSISSKNKILLFVGRISRDKGFDILLKSFGAIREKIKNVVLIINGQIDDKNLIREYNEDGIIYVEPRKDINHLYTMADLIILPSRTDPFPFVMLESGSFKKPFIGGNTGGIAEFIKDGKNGILIDPGDEKQLAEKTIFLLNNPDIAKRLGNNLYEKVNQLCDYNNYFKKVEKIYESFFTSG